MECFQPVCIYLPSIFTFSGTLADKIKFLWNVIRSLRSSAHLVWPVYCLRSRSTRIIPLSTKRERVAFRPTVTSIMVALTRKATLSQFFFQTEFYKINQSICHPKNKNAQWKHNNQTEQPKHETKSLKIIGLKFGKKSSITFSFSTYKKITHNL